MNARDDLHNIKLKLINLSWITLNSENKFIRVSRLWVNAFPVEDYWEQSRLRRNRWIWIFLKIFQGTFNNHVIINIIHDTTNDNIGSKSIQYQNAN